MLFFTLVALFSLFDGIFSDGFESTENFRELNHFGYYQIGWSSNQSGDVDDVRIRINLVKSHSSIVDTNVFPRSNYSDIFDIAIESNMYIAYDSGSINARGSRFIDNWREDFENRTVPLVNQYKDHILMWNGIDEPDLWNVPVSLMDTLYTEYSRWPQIPIFCNFEFRPEYDYLPRACDWIGFTPTYGSGDFEFHTVYFIKELLKEVRREDGKRRHLAIIGDGWQGWDASRCRHDASCIMETEIRRIREAYNTLHYIYAENSDMDDIDVKLYIVFIWEDTSLGENRGLGVKSDSRLISAFTEIGNHFPIKPNYEVDYEKRSVLLKDLLFDGVVMLSYLDKSEGLYFWENPTYVYWKAVSSNITENGTEITLPVDFACDFPDWYNLIPPTPLWRQPCEILVSAGPYEQLIWVDTNRMMGIF